MTRERGSSSRLSHSGGRACAPGTDPLPVTLVSRSSPSCRDPATGPRDVGELTGPGVGVERKVGPVTG
jgi:hypothetical protein